MRIRPVILGVVFLGTVVAVGAAAVAVGGGGRTRLSDKTATVGRATTTVPRPAPTTTVARATTVAPGAEADALVVRGAHGATEEPPGLVITNSGSAIASVGGNVVSGGPGGTGDGQPPAAVVTGDATAVGNSSTVRTP